MLLFIGCKVNRINDLGRTVQYVSDGFTSDVVLVSTGKLRKLILEY